MSKKLGKRKQREQNAQRPVTEADLVGKINFHLREISKVFRGQLKVTVIGRHPSDPNAHFFMTEDQIEPLKAMIDQQYALAKGEA
jgi:ABC-type xylose transport system substrate-binding protein